VERREDPTPPPARTGAIETGNDRDRDGIFDTLDRCPDEPRRGEGSGADAGCPAMAQERESPNLAVLLSLEPNSSVLKEGKQFDLWSGLGDAILEAKMCAGIQAFVVGDDPASRALRKSRCAAAEHFLLLKGIDKEDIVVDANADPSELIQRGMAAERLRNGVLLTPHDECPR
jgi:hypothetical protein